MKAHKLAFSALVLTISASLYASGISTELSEFAEEMSLQNCTETMGKVSSVLDAVNLDELQNEIKISGHENFLGELFTNKLKIHNKLRKFHYENGLSKKCATSARHALRSIRTVEDYVSVNYHLNFKEVLKFPDNSFGSNNPHVQRNPEFSDFDLKKDLKSGDIILSRGNAFTSAAIANLGEFDTQFSHMSIVYKKPNGELWTVEAHIEVGTFVRPLQDHINDKNYRTMIYRFDDEKIAEKAAEYIFKKAKIATDTTGNILYDFGFDQSDSSSLFCSEVISHAFEYVTQNKVQLPSFKSRLQARKPKFVRTLGITSESSFVPADIEVDPRFRIISEWRDASRTQENLQKDAILQAMFQWHDEFGYQMIQGSSKKAFIYQNVAWPLRRIPYFNRFVIDKLPLNMSRKLIGYFGVLESTGEFLQSRMKKVDDESLINRGYPLLKSEKYQVLNEVRTHDLNSRKKPLHKMYRPLKSKG